MKTKHFLLLFTLTTLLLGACTTARAGNPISPSESTAPNSITFPKINRHPQPAVWKLEAPAELPTYNPDSQDSWQIDLRARDLSKLDLKGRTADLLYADFDSRTTWPAAERMPQDYDWQQIMELGKNPGLGVRQLHTQGITGRGVGIAIIDQTLLVDHQEYANQVRTYEELDDITGGWQEPQIHGAAVASIAVGRSVGVAPEADLYYIATSLGNPQDFKDLDFTYLARGIRRILEINRQLPPEGKIRVISMEIGWGPESIGYEEITAAVQEAKAAGLLVVSSSIEEIHGFKFHGLGRAPTTDPDAFEAYAPGLWWTNEFFEQGSEGDRLLVPMDSRATASPLETDEYVFYRQGGWSWAMPYIAGMYALAAQVDPTITPERFWELALQTGRTIQIDHEGKDYPLRPILDPAALVAALKK